MPAPTLSLAVIRAADVNASLAFYSALGLNFVPEQHGTGPVHHSCALGGVVLEIYPGQEGTAPEPRAGGATMLGFEVTSLDEVLASLQALGIEPKSPPKEADWGRWINVTDPDGRVIQINQPL